MSNFYEILDCDVDASLEEIRKNYRLLVLKFHPDKNIVKDSRRFCLIQEAWEVLSDPRRRQLFDEELLVRNSNPILYGTFKIKDFHQDTSFKRYYHACRCGGYYYLEDEELKLTQTFRILHVPCENCSLTVQLIFEDILYDGDTPLFEYSQFVNQIRNCNCERKCFDRVPKEIQERIYEGYNHLPNNNEKNLYLYGLICKTSDKGDQPNSRASYRYFVKVNGFQVDICQKAFINVHGITPAKVRTLLHKLNEGVIYPNDRRGEARKLQATIASEASEQDVVNHITNVFQINEVWSRLKKGEKINVSKLWEDYRTVYHENLLSSNDGGEKDQTSADNNRLLSKSSYSIIFKKVYPEVIKKLDDKNELPPISIKRKRKSIPKKRNVPYYFVDANSKVNDEELENTTRELSKPQCNNESDVQFSSASSSVVHNIKTIQVIHLV